MGIRPSRFLILMPLMLAPVVSSAETNSEVLERIWATGKQNACSPAMRASFNETALVGLKSRIKDESDRTALAQIVNPFLFSLGYSHTQFFTAPMESYYLFKSYSAEAQSSTAPVPLLVNPGVQVGSDDHGFFVREALDGLPARNQGLVRGDRILAVDGVPFSRTWSSRAKEDAVIRISHLGQLRDVHVALPALNWSQAFQDATLNSIQMLSYAGKKIGYVHLWSGVHPQSADALWTAIRKFKTAHVDGVVLDLRGGYGGAFWSHLDPFFLDRKDYFDFQVTDGTNQTSTMKVEPQLNPEAYTGPLVVLIDEGARSGKEAMAYQFKKSHRAVVLGTATPGYFSGGGIFFADDPTADYILYLCVMRDSKLDGHDVEGIGIEPDVSVPFDIHNDLGDSQLKAALESF